MDVPLTVATAGEAETSPPVENVHFVFKDATLEESIPVSALCALLLRSRKYLGQSSAPTKQAANTT